MQKSAVLTFSAHDKDALLDEFREIVAAGELRSRMDVRWDSACDRLSDRYGWHLDDWKRIGRSQMGQKCNEDRGWVGLKGACKRGKKGGDNKAAIKQSKADLADKLRKRKGLSEIRSRDGKTSSGSWDITSAYSPLNQQQSSLRARRTSPGGKAESMDVSRIEKIRRSEEKRQQIASGVFPGKTITQRFEEVDRIREKYNGTTSLTDRRTAKQNAARLATRQEIDKAPVRLSNERSGKQPRNRGRSVD